MSRPANALTRVATTLIAVIVVAASAGPASAADHSPGIAVAGDLVIERDLSASGSASDIIRLDPRNGAETPLLTGPAFQGEGTYAFAQQYIGFTMFTSGNYQIFTAGPNGEAPTQRTTGSEDAFTPFIVVLFAGLTPPFDFVYASDGDIYGQNLDGTGLINLTPGTPNSFESNPVVSPQGNLVAAQSFNNSTFDVDIILVSPNGTNFRLLTGGNTEQEFHPAFDPKGQMVYFTTTTPSSGEDIYRINIDGTGLTPIVTGPNDQIFPHPAPDGTGLAYTSNAADYNGDGSVDGSDYEIWRKSFGGGGLRGPAGDVRLTTNAVPDYLTDWGVFSDETAPDLKLSGKKKQELGKQLTVKALCDEDCTATAKGTLTVPGSKGQDKLLKVTKFKLKKTKKQLAAGKAKTLKLKIPGNAGKAAEDGLEAGAKVKAKLTVSVVDASANKDSSKRTIQLTD